MFLFFIGDELLIAKVPSAAAAISDERHEWE